MKLINKISLKFILVTVVLLALYGFSLLYLIKGEIESEIDEELGRTTEEVIKNIKNERIISFEPFVSFQKMDTGGQEYSELKDVSIPDEDNESEIYRELTTYKTINGSYYKIIVRTSSLEQDDLFNTFVMVFLIITPILLIILYFVNRGTTKNELKPFYNNLNKLKEFSIKKGEKLEFEKSNVKEFIDLNNVLEALITRAVTEYRLVIESSENLSHELQTPISVIKTKLELILQQENIDNKTAILLNTIENNINKLSKINKYLIFLSKLENKEQFESENINLKEVIEKNLEFFEETIAEKNIKVTANYSDDTTINANSTLIDVLTANLISNASKHNLPGGKIEINADNKILEIKNNGKAPGVETEKLFERFAKDDGNSDSLGLGLSIVKQICNFYGYKVVYVFKDGRHTISVFFK